MLGMTVPVPVSSGGSSHAALAWLSAMQSGDRPGLTQVLGFAARPGLGGHGTGLGARQQPPLVGSLSCLYSCHCL